MELKSQMVSAKKKITMRSNRTFMELKYVGGAFLITAWGSNRTFMELKLTKGIIPAFCLPF